MQAALLDFQAGIYSVPLAPGDKKPLRQAWQQLRLQPAALAATFRQQVDRGRLLGLPPASSAPGGFAVCIDLDTPEAVTLVSRLESGVSSSKRVSSSTRNWKPETQH
ncbi:MAG: hypothetical protein HYV63_09120 [Candidatus Schekmanbacteria bacterium]|nr:hypothetical protein [Candidatus Schekmanbacteria bacterium]